MKEFQITLTEKMERGIRRFLTHASKAVPGILELHNIAPAEEGWELHDPIIYLSSSADFNGATEIPMVDELRSITLSVRDYVASTNYASGASVYLDGSLVGTSDASGEIALSNVTAGKHSIKIVATGTYLNSDTDDVAYDVIWVL